jgi:hypothetical protein
MYATRCPTCGAPTPVSLAEPGRLRCRGCGYEGPPPPEVAGALSQAASLVQHRSARERQLSGMQRRLLRSGAGAAIAYLAIGLLGMMPCTCCLVVYIGPEQGDDVTNWLCGGAPVLLLGAAIVAGFVAMRSARRRLGQACSALPPAAPGEPAGCHVCGGPVSGLAGDPFARCTFCGADNLVDTALLSRWHVARAAVIENYGQAALGESRRAGSVTRRAFVTVITLTVLGPVLGICLGGSSAVILDMVEVEPNDGERYAVVETPMGRCIARSERHGALTYLRFDPKLEAAGTPGPRPHAAVTVFDWRALRGLRVHAPNHAYLGPDDAVWDVARVHGVPGRPENRVILLGTAKAGEQRVPPHALCLDASTAPPATPVPVAYQQ